MRAIVIPWSALDLRSTSLCKVRQEVLLKRSCAGVLNLGTQKRLLDIQVKESSLSKLLPYSLKIVF